MPLLKNDALIPDTWIHAGAEDQLPAAGDVIVPFATLQADFETLAKRPGKLGVSLAQLNKKDEACTAFKQFQTQYPTAPVATKQSVQAESVRLGCK